MVVNQGDVYWVEIDEPAGSEPGYSHPHVVVQNNLFNHSKVRTVVVCLLTSNLKRAEAPGNVLLDEGEANLPKASVANATQLFTVDKTQLGEYIGTLSPRRVREIINGINLVITPRDLDK